MKNKLIHIYFILFCSDESHPLILRLAHAQKAIKATELRVNLFNLGYSEIMYLVKLGCMEFSVGGGYGALFLFKKEPIFTAIYGFIFVAVIVIFAVVYNRAFEIETLSEELSMEILVQCQHVSFKGTRDEFKKRIIAVRPIGIKLGGFYKVEREAAPIFTDFVLQQIIGLLLI